MEDLYSYQGNARLKPAGAGQNFTAEQAAEFIRCKADPVYFANWGIYTFSVNNWPLNADIIFSGKSNWWLGMSVESYSGVYGQSHGDPEDLFAATAFGGTAYSNTPIGFVCHTAEPTMSGINTLYYAERWAMGWNAAECAWVSIDGTHPHLLYVGYPFVMRSN